MKAIIDILGKKLSVALVQATNTIYFYIAGKFVNLCDINYFFACDIIDKHFPACADADPDLLSQAIIEAGNLLIDNYNHRFGTNY